MVNRVGMAIIHGDTQIQWKLSNKCSIYTAEAQAWCNICTNFGPVFTRITKMFPVMLAGLARLPFAITRMPHNPTPQPQDTVSKMEITKFTQYHTLPRLRLQSNNSNTTLRIALVDHRQEPP